MLLQIVNNVYKQDLALRDLHLLTSHKPKQNEPLNFAQIKLFVFDSNT